MQSSYGKNQTYIRSLNDKAVIEKLREGDKSATVLVQELNLSNSSMSSILKELTERNIIIQSKSISTVGKGRKQVYYTLNKDYGIFLIVCISNNRYKIILSNLKEEILLNEEKEIKKYDLLVFYEIILEIKSILARPEYRDLPLINIYIPIAGRVNSKTLELQLSNYFDKSLFEEKNQIKHLFEQHFNVPVYIQNDINLAIVGEKRMGMLDNCPNALLAFIDNGIGSSMILNDEFYGGSNGYAGELGLLRAYFNGKEDLLDEFVSIRSIKRYIYEKTGKSLKTRGVVELYETDKEIKEYIDSTATLLGKKLKDIIELLDVSKIVIQGRVIRFGNDYLACIRKEVMKSQNNCEVVFSELKGDSIFIGAISEAVNALIDRITSEDNDD